MACVLSAVQAPCTSLLWNNLPTQTEQTNIRHCRLFPYVRNAQLGHIANKMWRFEVLALTLYKSDILKIVYGTF